MVLDDLPDQGRIGFPRIVSGLENLPRIKHSRRPVEPPRRLPALPAQGRAVSFEEAVAVFSFAAAIHKSISSEVIS